MGVSSCSHYLISLDYLNRDNGKMYWKTRSTKLGVFMKILTSYSSLKVKKASIAEQRKFENENTNIFRGNGFQSKEHKKG